MNRPSCVASVPAPLALAEDAQRSEIGPLGAYAASGFVRSALAYVLAGDTWFLRGDRWDVGHDAAPTLGEGI